MPTVLRVGGYQFIMFSSDHPPPHLHVRREGKLAKILLDPISFERTGGFNASERSKILELVDENRELLLMEWAKRFPPDETRDHD